MAFLLQLIIQWELDGLLIGDNIMGEKYFSSLALIVMGLYLVLRFRNYTHKSLKSRMHVWKLMTFGKGDQKITKFDVAWGYILSILGGIIFLIFGIIRFFS